MKYKLGDVVKYKTVVLNNNTFGGTTEGRNSIHVSVITGLVTDLGGDYYIISGSKVLETDVISKLQEC